MAARYPRQLTGRLREGETRTRSSRSVRGSSRVVSCSGVRRRGHGLLQFCIGLAGTSSRKSATTDFRGSAGVAASVPMRNADHGRHPDHHHDTSLVHGGVVDHDPVVMAHARQVLLHHAASYPAARPCSAATVHPARGCALLAVSRASTTASGSTGSVVESSRRVWHRPSPGRLDGVIGRPGRAAHLFLPATDFNNVRTALRCRTVQATTPWSWD
jgi:hypothetical protein